MEGQHGPLSTSVPFVMFDAGGWRGVAWRLRVWRGVVGVS